MSKRWYQNSSVVVASRLASQLTYIHSWEKTKPVDPALHNVWILDNTAFRDGEQWKAEFVACYFIKNSGKVRYIQDRTKEVGTESDDSFQDVAKAVATVADALDLSLDDEELRKRMTKRLQPFADQILPNRTLQVTVDGKETLRLGPGNQSGYSSEVRDLSFA